VILSDSLRSSITWRTDVIRKPLLKDTEAAFLACTLTSEELKLLKSVIDQGGSFPMNRKPADVNIQSLVERGYFTVGGAGFTATLTEAGRCVIEAHKRMLNREAKEVAATAT
jgi:hypothetical protein